MTQNAPPNRRIQNLLSQIKISISKENTDEKIKEILTKWPKFAPIGFLPKSLKFSKEVADHLKWMSQKDSMGQDMFLIGHPGPFRRRLIFMYCELNKREIEYVVITRDTTEHDIKQRREIQDRNAYYVDQAAVKAAIHGRILIIDGIEKAERNILPVLNNLLENREMSLEDGRLLIDSKRYSELQVKTNKIIPVHKDFRVVALGIPIPPYEGNALDPPLRSRFQSRKFNLESLEIILHEIKEYKVPDLSISALMTFQQFIQQLKNYQEDMVKEFFPPLPMDHIIDIMKVLEKFGSVISEPYLQDMIRCIYPIKCFKIDPDVPLLEAVEKGIRQCTSDCYKNLKNDSKEFDLLEIREDGKKKITIFGNSEKIIKLDIGSGVKTSGSYDDYIHIPYHNRVIKNMLISHSLNRDFLIVGLKGTGKSMIVKQFASLLGYHIEYIPMFKDMTLRDLFKRRTTDHEGNTIWQKSPLLDAITYGHICVLDGVDRLGSDILLSLQCLIHDRSLFLIDGSRYVSQEQYSLLLKSYSEKELDQQQIYPIHSNFRIIATGLPPSKDESTQTWFTKEVLMLFHCHYLDPLSNQEMDLLIKIVPTLDKTLIKKLLDLKNDYNELKDPSSKYISTRDLIRVLKFITAFPNQSIYELFERITMIQFLPQDFKKFFGLLMKKYELSPPNSIEYIVEEKDGVVKIADISAKQSKPLNNLLVPTPFYVHTNDHSKILYGLLQDHTMKQHSLLIGNQGVGKNKITDYFLSVMKLEKEYMQLHRDITVQSLTVQPSVQDGVLLYIDSPLVRAVQNGRILMLDEADKAPLEVVSIIKSLLDDGEMVLSDDRRIIKNGVKSSKVIPIHPNFRMIVLANRPGFPFQGNDFFRECGDLFSSHYVDNPKGENEIKMLRQYGPSVPLELIQQLTLAFNDLRKLVDENIITYPYSTRELVSIVKHLEKYPESGLMNALQNVIAFDMFNEQILGKLKEVFSKHGINIEKPLYLTHNEKSKEFDFDLKEIDSDKKESNEMGEGLGDGVGQGEGRGEGQGSGGTGTGSGEGQGSGGGGSGGGNNYETSSAPDAEYKSNIYVDSMINARKISQEALDKKLKQIDMKQSDLVLYNDSYNNVKSQISQLRVLLENLRSKEKERVWLKNKSYGEIDDNKIVEGITGEKLIYQRKGEGSVYDSFIHKKKKVLHFVMDVSSSMFRFNGYDKRLNRMMEVAVCIMESLAGFEDRYLYSISGHSGDSFKTVFAEYGNPPKNKNEMLQAILQMQNHATTCSSGDTTVDATEWAIEQAAKIDADERFVFIFSDANISAYGFNGKNFSKTLDKNKKVKSFVIFISSPNGEAENIVKELPDRRGYTCYKADDLGKTFQKIFTSNVLTE